MAINITEWLEYPERVSPEAQELKVVITDAVGNTKTWNTKLNW